jgi:hypothetical protein
LNIISSSPGPELLRRVRVIHFSCRNKLDRPHKAGDDEFFA